MREFKIGDEVIFSKYGGSEVRIGHSRTLRVVRECDLLGVIEG